MLQDRTPRSTQAASLQGNGAPKAVIFLHIPKTAGLTLLGILDRQYPAEVVYSFGNNAHESVVQYKALDEERRKEIRLLRGHMAYGLHEYLPNPAEYFTLFRDPVTRVISYYNFIRRTEDHYLYDEVMSKDLSLHNLLESGLPLMMNDGQVRLISGVWGEPAFGEVSDAMLETAKKNLVDSFVVVGITEQFDKTLFLLKEKLNWQQDIYYRRLNVSSQGVTEKRLPTATIELVKELNRQDIALYAYAQDLFMQQCSQQGALFDLRVRYFQLINKYQPLMKQLRSYSIRTKLKNFRI